MDGFIDPNGITESAGIAAAVRRYGKNLAMDIVRSHERYLAGDHDQVDNYGRSYYKTGAGLTIVFFLPAAPPWLAVVSLPQELV